MISSYESQYIHMLRAIYENGFSDGINERTKKETKRLPGVVLQVDVAEEFPILKSKQVFGKTSLNEILWIWQQQSNNIKDLKAHIWDSWADENGSIGKAYGYLMSRPICIYTDPVHKTPESFRCYKNQAGYILEYLREFPNGRWGVATIWNPEELSGMNLVPCCHTSTWNLDGGRLNCVLDQRSGDMPYGVPFNTTQYAELMILFARDLGVKPGILTHVIADAHIYDNQMDGVRLQLAYVELLSILEDIKRMGGDKTNEEFDKKLEEALKLRETLDIGEETARYESVEALKSALNEAIDSDPRFVVDSEETNFFKVSADDCSVKGYSHMGKIDFGEVAV